MEIQLGLIRHNKTGKAKLRTLNTGHKTIKVKRETRDIHKDTDLTLTEETQGTRNTEHRNRKQETRMKLMKSKPFNNTKTLGN